MSANGQHDRGDGERVLHWPGRVLTAGDLRTSLNGHREVLLAPGTLVTPLAADELKANGIRIVRETPVPSPKPAAMESGLWGYAEERPHPLVQSAVQSLQRERLPLRPLQPEGKAADCLWARAVAECVAHGECRGGVVFCQDPALVCCVANKVAGLRAAAANTVAQATRATLTLGANLLVVEMPGRTFFEVRQILRTLCACGGPDCPPGVACTLRELDGHAHR
jgi:hypothetical protein